MQILLGWNRTPPLQKQETPSNLGKAVGRDWMGNEKCHIRTWPDDGFCLSPGTVTEVRFWGAWKKNSRSQGGLGVDANV